MNVTRTGHTARDAVRSGPLIPWYPVDWWADAPEPPTPTTPPEQPRGSRPSANSSS